MTAIQAVVFDIGNVLLGWQPERVFDRLIGPERRTALFAEVDLHGMNLRVDRGAPLGESIAEMRAAHPHWAEEIQLWQDHWDELLSPVLTESVALMQRLRERGLPVYALSNFGTDTFERARAVHAFLNDFDMAFISGRMGVVKPEPEIFAAVEEAVPFSPDALLFTDDNAANIAMAAQRGWQTHQFLTATALQSSLQKLGVRV